MSDGAKGPLAQAVSDISEAVVQPIKDEVGQAVEQGKQSVFNTTTKPTDPVQDALKKQEEFGKIAEAQRKIKYWKDLDEAQRRVREEEKRKRMMGLRAENQKTEADQVKQFKVVQRRQENIALAAIKTKTEAKKGVGG